MAVGELLDDRAALNLFDNLRVAGVVVGVYEVVRRCAARCLCYSVAIAVLQESDE